MFFLWRVRHQGLGDSFPKWRIVRGLDLSNTPTNTFASVRVYRPCLICSGQRAARLIQDGSYSCRTHKHLLADLAGNEKCTVLEKHLPKRVSHCWRQEGISSHRDILLHRFSCFCALLDPDAKAHGSGEYGVFWRAGTGPPHVGWYRALCHLAEPGASSDVKRWNLSAVTIEKITNRSLQTQAFIENSDR